MKEACDADSIKYAIQKLQMYVTDNKFMSQDNENKIKSVIEYLKNSKDEFFEIKTPKKGTFKLYQSLRLKIGERFYKGHTIFEKNDQYLDEDNSIKQVETDIRCHHDCKVMNIREEDDHFILTMKKI